MTNDCSSVTRQCFDGRFCESDREAELHGTKRLGSAAADPDTCTKVNCVRVIMRASRPRFWRTCLKQCEDLSTCLPSSEQGPETLQHFSNSCWTKHETAISSLKNRPKTESIAALPYRQRWRSSADAAQAKLACDTRSSICAGEATTGLISGDVELDTMRIHDLDRV
jgi:hypothetical protein